MGAPMAKRLVDWPGGLIGLRRPRLEAMTPLAEAGATLADSVADVAAADIISVTVLNDAAGARGRRRAGRARQAGHRHRHPLDDQPRPPPPNSPTSLRPEGIHIVDAPVSGGAGAAEKGELAVMVGADREVYERIKPAFKQWASLVVHAGEPGAGTRMKLARNMLTFISFAAACEAMKLAEAAGIDLQQLGPGRPPHRRAYRRPGRDHGPRRHASRSSPTTSCTTRSCTRRGLGEKDLSLALALGEADGVDLPLAEMALQNLAAGLGVPHTASTTKE